MPLIFIVGKEEGLVNILKNEVSGRSPLDQVKKQGGLFLEATSVSKIVNALPYIVLILNSRREVVFANRFLLQILSINNPESVHGLRPGEVLNCIHAYEGDGCGTTEFCRTCGANQVMLSSLHGEREVKECRILQKTTGEALDLQVKATPIVIDHERFTIFTVIDISHEKRRKVLERVFFHDVLNTAGALRGYLDLLQSAEHWEVNEILQNINRIGEQLIDEILAQKQLVAAEDNELCAEPTELDSLEFLNDLMTVYRGHPLSENRTMVIDRHSPGVRLSIDVTLLRRVICNMVKNALESSENGETITIGCRRGDDDISFWVHSPKFIPREIQLQIFKRSFSTKGEGRGLGTYSMKLLSERYLKGKVWFTSSETEGTVFAASYPISMNGKNSDYAHSVNFINSLMK